MLLVKLSTVLRSRLPREGNEVEDVPQAAYSKMTDKATFDSSVVALNVTQCKPLDANIYDLLISAQDGGFAGAKYVIDPNVLPWPQALIILKLFDLDALETELILEANNSLAHFVNSDGVVLKKTLPAKVKEDGTVVNERVVYLICSR